jgi:transcriptional regulator with XRE-family HTH domain
MLSVNTPLDLQKKIAAQAKARRLSLRLTQEGLAQRSGVSLGSLKRFERTGHIALVSLLQLAVPLNALTEFERLFPALATAPQSIEDLFKKTPVRKRGRIT